MSDNLGMPIWYELMTTDVAGASLFYRDIVGWTAEQMATGDGGPPYTIWHAEEGDAVGGMMRLPDDAPAPPGWSAYFHVADVDAKVAENEAAGGTTFMPAHDIPDVGRIAYVADARGIAFYMMTPQPPPGTPAGAASTSFSETLPQRCSWNELATKDHKEALSFYGRLLGWRSTEAMPMGAMGDYSFVDCGGTRIGAMMDAGTDAEMGQGDGWTFYFRIADVDAVADRIAAGGGRVLIGPMSVPGGQRIIVAADPQGARVGFVSGEGA